MDLATCVKHARDKLGYRKVVLVGWSGGGPVMAGYQAEAQSRRIKQTAAGEPTALASLTLPPGDALLLIASHRSRHHLLTGQLDPSILDEREPERRDSSLNLYDERNIHKIPFEAAYLARFRAEQLARNRRITAWVKDKLRALRSKGEEHAEFCFTVHGTMADPRWVDPSIEPNGRRPNSTYMGPPSIVNDSPSALGRYTSLRSWLSQWSYDDAQVDSVDAGPRITVPSLLITAGADDACPVSHTQAVFDALGARDKQSHLIEGANHYFTGEHGRAHLESAMQIIRPWLAERGL